MPIYLPDDDTPFRFEKNPASIYPAEEPLEQDEQTWLFETVFAHENLMPELRYAFHVPNGGARPSKTYVGKDGKTHRYSREAQKMRSQGVRKGVPDICWPLPRKRPDETGEYRGLYIEMKRVKSGSLEPEQKAWRDFLLRQGYFWKMCRGNEDAWETMKAYYRLEAVAEREIEEPKPTRRPRAKAA